MASQTGELPLLGISRCLLGELVRYDGGHRQDAALVEALRARVRLVPVCPEVEAGLGVPREPMHFVNASGGRRLVTVDSGRDCTATLSRWCEVEARRWQSLGVRGAVLKARSPSCGLSVVVSDGSTTPGLFVEALARFAPGIVVENAENLADNASFEAFLARISGCRAAV
ncbi:MAG: DUF523 domain-containing protein [Magnetococcales bacterium]|nr:DUF523 domain-containing protein [Magnetococcales bacterium]